MNATLRTVRAKKITPDGKEPGTIYQVTQDVADILTMPGADIVEYVDEAELEPVAKKGDRYNRRDLRAKE